MDNFLIQYIAQRMREMDFKDYSFEPIRVSSAALELEFIANNEYYYLVSKTVHNSLVIKSDTNIFNEGASYGNFNFYQLQEFTGQISISCAIAIDLEFVRVIPRVPRNDRETATVDQLLGITN